MVGTKVLNQICNELYSSSKGNAESIDLADVNKIKESANSDLLLTSDFAYWLATYFIDVDDYNCIYVYSYRESLRMTRMVGGGILRDPGGTNYIRPIVTLNSDVTLTAVSDGVWSIN